MKDPIIKEKKPTPASMIMMPIIFSALEIGNKSPYPTVERVVIEK
jgi:hypothetical protein